MINHPHRSKRATSPGPVASTKRKRIPVHDHDADWAALLTAVRGTFAMNAGATLVGGALFETKTTDLADVFLDNIMGDEYQTHNCTACKSFLRSTSARAPLTSGIACASRSMACRPTTRWIGGIENEGP